MMKLKLIEIIGHLKNNKIPRHYVPRNDTKVVGPDVAFFVISNVSLFINQKPEDSIFYKVEMNGLKDARYYMRKAGFEPQFSHIPVPRRIKVWQNVPKRTYAVAGACEPPSKDKAGIDLQTP